MISSDPRTLLRRSVRRGTGVTLVSAALAALLAGGLPALAHEGHDGPETGPNDPNAPRRLSDAAIKNGGITIVDVASRVIEKVVRVPGRIAPRPDTAYDLHAPIEGLVLKVEAVPGQILKAGDPVARLGGATLAALVGEWDKLRGEAKGAAEARDLVAILVEREASIALEGRRLDLLVAASEHQAAADELDAAKRAGESLPERERRTRAAAEAQARVRLVRREVACAPRGSRTKRLDALRARRPRRRPPRLSGSTPRRWRSGSP